MSFSIAVPGSNTDIAGFYVT